MKIQIETIGPCEKKISFEIPRDLVSQEIESTYRTLSRKVKVKGFRPGKAPRAILSRHYKTQVEEEVTAKLIADSFKKALEEYQLAPLAEPAVLDRVFEEGKDFIYTAKVEVKPEVTVEGYLDLEIEMPPVSLSEEEVETQLKVLQDSHAQLRPLEPLRPVQEKDFVILDFVGRLAGKPVEGWEANDHLVEAGSPTMVGDLARKLIGLSQNEEKDITVILPGNYHKKELAGKEINVHLKIKEIKEKILPPLDDEFAKDVGDYNTLADLKARLRQTLEEQKKDQARQAAKEKIFDTIIEKHPFPVPPSMVERQVQNLMARAEIRLARQGMKLDETNLDLPKLRDSFLPVAEKNVRGHLILEKIAGMEKLSVSEAEEEENFEKLAAQLNQRVEAVKNYYQKNDLLDDLRAKMLEEKTLDFLLSQAKITEKENAPAATPAGDHPEGK